MWRFSPNLTIFGKYGNKLKSCDTNVFITDFTYYVTKNMAQASSKLSHLNHFHKYLDKGHTNNWIGHGISSSRHMLMCSIVYAMYYAYNDIKNIASWS